MDQNGRNAREVKRDGPVVAWTSEGRGGKRYLALFNRSDAPVNVQHDYAFYGLTGRYRARDVWKGVAVDGRAVSASVPAHGSLLLELSR
jgi:hypothetical protein